MDGVAGNHASTIDPNGATKTMSTIPLTSSSDTLGVYIGLNGSTDGGASFIGLSGNIVDAGAGRDVADIHDSFAYPHFTMGLSTDGVITITTASGSASLKNFETIKFYDLTLNLGTSGNDTVTDASTGGGNALYGFAGSDLLNGGAGADKMYGGAGDDTYVVDNAADVVSEAAGQGIDLVKSSISYALGANVENLTLTGASAIKATGNALGNVITGNGAANSITGGGGHDVMTGGGGADVFYFKALTDTTKIAATRDVITDFMHLVDKIDLVMIDANAHLAGNQAFSLIKAGAFSGHAGELHALVAAGNTIVEGDVNGDKVADFQIQLNGIKALTAADFIL